MRFINPTNIIKKIPPPVGGGFRLALVYNHLFRKLFPGVGIDQPEEINTLF